MFLFIGGEGPQGAPSDHLFMATLAQREGALMVALEHRFYGESRPTNDMSVGNLKFLTSEQALGDLAHFTNYLKNPDASKSSPALHLKYSAADSKFVTFGGSYPGALSAWYKLKYPQTHMGAVASSAPVYAEYNYEQYAEVVGAALANPLLGGGPACYAAVEKSTTTLRALVTSTSPYGINADIPAALRPCNSSGSAAFSSELDLATYEASVFGNFQGVVQYNMEIPTAPTVAVVCGLMTNATIGAPLARLAAVNALLNPANPKAKVKKPVCVQSSFIQDSVAPLANVSFSAAGCNLTCNSMRQWIWQSCHEFGWFQTTSAPAKLHPFAAFTANNVKNAGRATCEGAFGLDGYTGPNVHWELDNYGGRDLAGANITMVNGNMDPWHALSIVNATNRFYDTCVLPDGSRPAPGSSGSDCPAQRVTQSETVVEIDGTAHCGDMYAPGMFAKKPFCPGPACHNDSASLDWAHVVIGKQVHKYLS